MSVGVSLQHTVYGPIRTIPGGEITTKKRCHESALSCQYEGSVANVCTTRPRRLKKKNLANK